MSPESEIVIKRTYVTVNQLNLNPDVQKCMLIEWDKYDKIQQPDSLDSQRHIAEANLQHILACGTNKIGTENNILNALRWKKVTHAQLGLFILEIPGVSKQSGKQVVLRRIIAP